MRGHRNRGSPPAAAAPSSSPGKQRRMIMMELLERGVHASPREGCSVLEYASVLAGERWSSCPQSVHPALAAVAGLVNDQMTDDRRRMLTPLAPWLLGTNTIDPGIWPAITEACVRAALTRAGEPDKPRLLADLDATRNWRAGVRQSTDGRLRAPWAGRRERQWARNTICSALLAAATSADQGDADVWLCQVLVYCVNECRRLVGESAVDPRLPTADCPQHLAVEPHLVWSPGCDWVELCYRPVHTLTLSSEWPRGSGSADARKAEPATAPVLVSTWNAK